MSPDGTADGPDRALRDALSRALREHASAAPDAGEVHARITAGVARRHRRRQAAGLGGIALAVTGLVLGAEALAPTPQEPSAPPAAEPSPADVAPTAPPQPAPSPDDVVSAPQLAREAFSRAGYTYDDAVALAELWRSEVVAAKSVAGQQLLDGATLPLRPGEPARAAGEQEPAVDRAVDAFLAAGYAEDDLVVLARLWKEEDFVLKAVAGQQLLDGVELPEGLDPS